MKVTVFDINYHRRLFDKMLIEKSKKAINNKVEENTNQIKIDYGNKKI